MKSEVNLSLQMWAKANIEERLNFILALMAHERDLASTHSQRNAYQHVVRVEIEDLLHDVRYAHIEDPDDLTAIPF